MDIILKYFSDFTENQLRQFQLLGPLYEEWNEKINVISRKDIGGLYEKHVLHSLSIAATFDWKGPLRVLDLGTGGGFPGIPLAIFFPDIHFHLVDSIAKKLKVVEGVATEIGLTNVTVQHTRVEAIRDLKYDFVVSRAVAPLKDLWQWSKPLLKTTRSEENAGLDKPGLICLKGGDLAEEIHESRLKPHVRDIISIFPEPYFEEKYLLYVPR